ncbi:5-(carboxyamino)imidazole ribonucleotide mutase [bacterium]|nr:5-(carboxyamino)imidazole ribonucleotide mutase [bacterium]
MNQTSKVAILMGSKSDMPVMEKAGDVFKEFGVDHEIHVMSAHRNPKKVADFVSQAKAKGFAVIIAGAGMAAHLAGAVAAHTPLPVIGVPLTSQPGLGGLDSLLATVQMPRGVPVATVAVDGSKNAAYLAIQIMSLSNEELAKKFDDFRARQSS